MKVFETNQDCFDYYINRSKAETLDYALSCFEHIKELAAELERCVVMGGDGKPIEFGGKTYVRSPYTGKVKELEVDRLVIVSSSRTIVGNDFPYRPSDCYSSPDQVPEGGK